MKQNNPYVEGHTSTDGDALHFVTLHLYNILTDIH